MTIDLSQTGLEVADLGVTRGGQRVLADLSFSARPGTLTLVRGPNGAGKSTLLLALAGLLPDVTGTIAWSGTDPDREAHEHLHFLGHRPAVDMALTVAENLCFWVEYCGGSADLTGPLETVGLLPLAAIEASHLSAGQTKRLALARLIACPRPVWLLDEPTASLDADGDRLVGALVADHVARGGLVIAATHLDLVGAGTPAATLTLGDGP